MSKYIGTPVVNLSVDTVDVTGDITATDSTPELILLNDTHEDTDGGREGKVTFKGEQSGGEVTVLAQIQSGHDGTSDDEKGDLIFKTNDGSDGNSPTERLRIDSGGNVKIGTTATASHGAADNHVLALSGSQNNGSGVLAFIDTSGNSDALLSGNDGSLTINVDSSNATADSSLQIRLDNTEEYRFVDTAAHGAGLGIGTTAPLRQLHISNTSANSEIAFTAATNGVSSVLFGDGLTGSDVYRGYVQYNHSDEAMLFGVGAAERMRLDNSENLIIGKTSSSFSADGLVLSGTGNSSFVKTSDTVIFCNRLGTDGKIQAFYKAGTEVGSIVVFSSHTSYSTSSDYRMKENVVNIDDGITRVKQLSPKRFNFISDSERTVDGFLAHEAQTVVPESVHGTKDEVEVWADGDELPDGVSVGDNKLDDDGNTIPVMQGIDQAKLVPLLTAALQEAIAKIETLETKVAALEGE